LLGLGVLAGEGASQDAARVAFGVWDTGKPSADPLTVAALAARSGWTLVAPGGAPAPQGDVVVSNGRITMVARRQGTGVEVYTPTALRARLTGGLAAVETVALVENARASAAIEVAWKTGAARFKLKRGDLFVEASSVAGDAPLRVECPSRFVVLPDFFADDILVDARKVAQDRVELPSENFVLHFTGAQDAIVMDVFENRDQEVQVTAAGRGAERSITGSEIRFGKGRKIWVAVLEGPGLWLSRDLGPDDAKKVIPLGWQMPFVAEWRVDFTRQDDLTDSWDVLLQEKEGGEYIKPSWLADDGQISAASRTSTGEVDRDAYKPGGPASERLGPDRKRWTTVLGHVLYPCWTDHERKGYLQPLEHKRLTFRGPALLYPLNRLSQTPVDAFTPVDIVRNTLGVGPCQYILDVEGQKQEHVGRATCHVRSCLNEIFGAGQQKARDKDVANYLNDAHDFVAHIRSRILSYVAFGQEVRKYLAEERGRRPEIKDRLEALEALAREIDERVEPRWQKIRDQKVLKDIEARLVERKVEPTTPALVKELNRAFLENLAGYEGADWKDRVKREYTDPLTTIGGNQDDMVGECRWVVKALRQKAAVMMAEEPRAAAVAAELRARCQKMLRGGAAYEGARH
jgi:hypothetical protein